MLGKDPSTRGKQMYLSQTSHHAHCRNWKRPLLTLWPYPENRQMLAACKLRNSLGPMGGLSQTNPHMSTKEQM